MSVQAPQSSYFPQIPSADPSKRPYDESMESARSEYVAHYENYRARAQQIDNKTKEWTDYCNAITNKPMAQLEKDFAEKVDEYIVYQTIRNDTLRIIKTYDEVIVRCHPPTLDPDTLTILQDLKQIRISDIKTKYDQTFTTQLNELKEQRDAIQKLYDEIRPSLRALRQSLEPLAVVCSKSTSWFAVPAMFNGVAGRTPYVNVAVEARKRELALVRAPQPQLPAQAQEQPSPPAAGAPIPQPSPVSTRPPLPPLRPQTYADAVRATATAKS